MKHRSRLLNFSAVMVLLTAPARAAEAPVNPPPSPATPEAMFNAGTRQLRAGKLPAAEDLLQGAVASQDPRLQPLALYNLGCTRVAEGAEFLKQGKDPAGRTNPVRVDGLTDQADDASRLIDDAIASANEEKMVQAYLHGGGVHRETSAATKAVRKALESQRQTLAKWQRAAGDFRSAVEMEGTDADALYNAGATERAIAALVDKLNQLQQSAARMNAAGHQLGEKLQKLKGMIPAPDMPPGAPGDDDDEDMQGLQPGQQEGEGKTGEEIKISAEEAQQLLNGYKLGGDHPLRMGDEGTKKPKNPTGKNW
jgi:hypothetical protein